MRVGGKGDEMGWSVYDTCRQQGAIIITGHEHTYHRTKTLTSMQNQIIESSCRAPFGRRATILSANLVGSAAGDLVSFWDRGTSHAAPSSGQYLC
jgi:hypothetical protein